MGTMEDTIEKITNLPAPLMLAVVAWVFGLCLKRTDFIPNKYIPLITCITTLLIYPQISSDERVGFSYIGIKPIMYLKGFAIGAMAVAGNEILKNIPIIGPFFEKIQNAFKRNGNDTTTTIKKPENYESQISKPDDTSKS